MMAINEVTRTMGRRVACPKCRAAPGEECDRSDITNRAHKPNHFQRQQAYAAAVEAGTERMPKALDVVCPECGSEPNVDCVAPGSRIPYAHYGVNARTHRQRIRAASAVLA